MEESGSRHKSKGAGIREAGERARPKRPVQQGCGREGNAVLRQAISCDICGAEKKQTNNWFLAYEKAGELHISWLNSRARQRPDLMHFCGQTCLHKLVDEFMAKAIAGRQQRPSSEVEGESPAIADTSLTAAAAHADVESSARLLAPSAPLLSRAALRSRSGIVTVPTQPNPAELAAWETSSQTSANWHAQAWERERQRELRAAENHPEIARRRSSA